MSKALNIETVIKAQFIFDANNTTFTVSECATYLKVTIQTVKNRINKGTIHAAFLSGKYHIPKLQFVEKIVANFLEKETENNEEVTLEDKINAVLAKKFIN